MNSTSERQEVDPDRRSRQRRGPIFRRRDDQGREYGNWIVAYCYRGEEKRESCKSRKRKVAEALLRQRLGEIGRGRLVGPTAERVTVAELLDDLRVDYAVRGLASLPTVKAHIETLNTVFGQYERAVDVTTARWNRAVQAWLREGIAAATINKRRGSLMRAFNLARESEPPKVLTVPKLPRLEEHNARQGFFEKGEFYAVLAGLPDDGLRDFAEWAYWTGMRKGEIAKLTWAAFDRETWTLTLAAKDAKSRKARRVPLVGPLRAIIERRIAARRLDCLLIFHRDGAPVYEFRKSWQSACRAAGVEGRLFHDLRRTGVRNLRRAGVDRRVAMTISGHRTESVFERYNIGSDEDLRDAVAKVAAYVESLPTTQQVMPLPKAASA